MMPEELEECIAGVLANELGRTVPEIRDIDDFASMGLDSLLAAYVVAEMEDVFRCEITIEDVYAAAGVKQLALSIGQKVSTKAER